MVQRDNYWSKDLKKEKENSLVPLKCRKLKPYNRRKADYTGLGSPESWESPEIVTGSYESE